MDYRLDGLFRSRSGAVTGIAVKRLSLSLRSQTRLDAGEDVTTPEGSRNPLLTSFKGNALTPKVASVRSDEDTLSVAHEPSGVVMRSPRLTEADLEPRNGVVRWQ
jgi:hypothetical protein